MMEEWKEYRLGELLKIRYGKDHKKLKDGHIPVYGSGGIMRYADTSIFSGPSILIPRKGTLSNIFYVDTPFWTVDTMFWSEIETNKVHPSFLFYAICKKDFASLNVGTAVPSLTVPVIESLSIKIPSSLDEQRKIATMLSELDDKIAVNRRICENLESQAQALFKHWFIDFAPFKDGKFVETELGMIPEGWRVGKIKELDIIITDYVSNGSFASLKENVTLFQSENYAYFIRNTDLKESSFNVYVDKHSYDFLSKSVLFGGEIIISNVGDVGSVHLCPQLDKPMTLGNNIIMIKTPNKPLRDYLYILFKWSYGKSLIKSITGGSAQPKFNKGDFKALNIVIPDNNSLNKFDNLLNDYIVIIEELKKESSRLASLRDTLLPKLMSGQIKVNETGKDL